MEMPHAHKQPASSESLQKNEQPDKGKTVELTFDEAKNTYEAGQDLRNRIMEIVNDDDYCYDLFNEVHSVIFKDMHAEDVSQHIMHRILVGTMISEQEVRSLIFDHKDMEIYEKFLVPASCAGSKEELGAMVKDLLNRHGVSYIVQ